MCNTSILKTQNYKGYNGSYMWDEEAQIYHGRLNDTTDVITFEGKTIEALTADFEDAVEDYILSFNDGFFK